MSLSSPVCVVGGEGWVGGSIVCELINKGYDVRAIVQDAGDPAGHLSTLQRRIEKSIGGGTAEQSSSAEKKGKQLSGSLDLISTNDLEKAVKGCRGFIHALEVADVDQTNPVEQLVSQVSRSLEAAAKEPEIARVVMLSSMSSVCGPHREYHLGKLYEPDHVWTERDINDHPKSTFAKAVTASERAAWDLVRGGHKEKYSLATIHPSVVWGPLADNQKPSGAQAMLLNLINGKEKALVEGDSRLDVFGIVHIHDVVQAHIAALEEPKATNQRYLCTSDEQYTLSDVTDWIRIEFPEAGHHLRGIAEGPEVEKVPPGKLSADNSKVRALMGVDQLIPARKALIDSIDSFLAHRLLVLNRPENPSVRGSEGSPPAKVVR